MRTWTVILITAMLGLAASLPARADSDVDVSVRLGGGSWDYGYDSDWYWGDNVLYGDWGYRRSAIGITVGDRDWRRFDARAPFADANDRGGYRAFIPRGRQGPPELYGDYIVDQNGYPIRPRRSTPYYPRDNYRHHRYGYGGYPVVIPYTYGYGYDPYYGYYGTPIYSAPANPQYGYYPPARGLQFGAGDPGYGYGATGDVYTDNSVTNNYYGDAYVGDRGSSAAPPPPAAASGYEPVGPPAPAPASPPQAAPAAPGRALGARFYDSLRLDTADGAQRFSLVDGKLYSGPENGPGELVSKDAAMDFGAFACWLPDVGTVVIFREGEQIAAAYRTPAGEWWVEALPYNVDFGATTSIGIVGGAPWVTFTALDGARYVVAFSGGLWQEVGSGSSAK